MQFHRTRCARVLLLAVLVLGVCLTGCVAADSGDAGAGPSLVALDSVVLAEGDRTYVGLASGFLVAADGRFFISDLFSHRVLAFGRGGEYLGSFGRQGNGPGEFTSPSWLALDGDSLLFVANSARRRIEVFDARTGEFRWGRRLAQRFSSLAAHEGRLFAGYLDIPSHSSVGSFAGESDSLLMSGPLPRRFVQSALIPDGFGTVEIAAYHDTLATAYEVTNRVYLSRAGGGVIDSILVPAVRRNGVRHDLLDRITDDPNTGMDAIYQSSLPARLARLSSGIIALASLDPQLTNGRITGTLYLSLVDPKRRRACPDAVIPGPDEPPARVAFRADTLFALAQEVMPDGRAQTIIRAYRVDAGRCTWVPTDDGEEGVARKN